MRIPKIHAKTTLKKIGFCFFLSAFVAALNKAWTALGVVVILALLFSWCQIRNDEPRA